MADILGMFKKSKNTLEQGGISPVVEPRVQCPSCKSFESKRKQSKNNLVCSRCGHHFRMNARDRIALICDKGSFSEMFGEVVSTDPLEFPGYDKKLMKARALTGESEGVVCGVASINKNPCAIFVMEADFMMGSMGSAVGERITRTFEFATKNRLPIIGFTASGGARMQEGILSLMQMAKISGAVQHHSAHNCLYITVLTDPTTGGVTASFAMLGDIILSEPKALIGFAGKRVIEQTIKRKLPEDFQSAEFLLEHGFVDAIVPRKELRETLSSILGMHRRRRA